MAIKIPENQIQYNYTSGKEYLLKDTYKEYIGHYYILNEKQFAGKEFNTNAPALIPIPKNNTTPSGFNVLLANAATFLYGKLSKVKINNSSFNSSPFNPTNEDFTRGYVMRYFIKKVNVNNPIIIKEINKDTFDSFKDPLYQTLEVKYNFNITNKELEELDKKMPGLKSFLQDYAPPTSSDEKLNL